MNTDCLYVCLINMTSKEVSPGEVILLLNVISVKIFFSSAVSWSVCV